MQIHSFSFFNKILDWLANFLLVQLFINLFTWPLFLSWGLPITPLSIIGNLIFTPFLTAFLVLSSIITLCIAFSLPSTFIATLLEHVTTLWLWIVALPTPSCLITCVTPPLFLTLCAPFGASYIILSKRFSTTLQKIGALLVMYLLLFTLFLALPTKNALHIPYGSHTVMVVNDKGKLTLIDPGFTRRKKSMPQWITYTLLPALATTFGKQTIDELVLKKSSSSATACAELLHTRGIVKTIRKEIPYKRSTGDERAKTMPSFHVVP